MTDQVINVEIVKDSRPALAKFGALLGKQIFTVEKVACDLQFASKQQEALAKNLLMPSRPINRFKVKAIDIVSVDTAKDADGAPVVVLNPGRTDSKGHSLEIVCPMVDPKLSAEVSVQTVADAINKKTNSPIFFSNGRRLAEQVNVLNRKEIAAVTEFINDLKAQLAMVDTTMTTNTNNVEEYYKQLDTKSPSSTEAHVHIEA